MKTVKTQLVAAIEFEVPNEWGRATIVRKLAGAEIWSKDDPQAKAHPLRRGQLVSVSFGALTETDFTLDGLHVNDEKSAAGKLTPPTTVAAPKAAKV